MRRKISTLPNTLLKILEKLSFVEFVFWRSGGQDSDQWWWLKRSGIYLSVKNSDTVRVEVCGPYTKMQERDLNPGWKAVLGD